MPELPHIAAYIDQRAWIADRGTAGPANTVGQPLPASFRRAASYGCRRPDCAPTAANRQTNCHWSV